MQLMKTLKVTLDYGRTGLAVELPAERVVGPLAIRDVPPLDDPEEAVAAALETPIGTPPLREIARGARDACILICDITRPVPNRTILRPMLQVLHEAGIPRERDLDPGRHRPAPAQHRRREGRDARRGDRLGAIASKTITARGSRSTRWSARRPRESRPGSTAATSGPISRSPPA